MLMRFFLFNMNLMIAIGLFVGIDSKDNQFASGNSLNEGKFPIATFLLAKHPVT